MTLKVMTDNDLEGLWQPLAASKQEIHLLVLHPAPDPEKEPSCELRSVSLHDEPTYEALSYCWGDTSDQRTILLHGIQYQATRNLFQALKALRYQQEPRYLWVDAVCINQNDLDERASGLFSKAACSFVPTGGSVLGLHKKPFWRNVSSSTLASAAFLWKHWSRF